MRTPAHARTTIVVIGGGFAGLAAALELERLRRRRSDYNVILVDRNCYHLYHALLYEVATAAVDITPEEAADIRKGICVRLKSLRHLLLQKDVQLIQREVTGFDLANRAIQFAHDAPLPYDQAVIALGSATNFFGVPGLEANAVTMKDLPDALEIHARLKAVIAAAAAGQTQRIVIGGGGVSGVEVAGEIGHYLARMKRRLDPRLVHIDILEASPTVLPGMGEWAQNAAAGRLAQFGVRIHTGQPITAVDAGAATLKDGTAYPYDLLIWSGGIQAHPLIRALPVDHAGKGQAVVTPTLQPPAHPDVYIAGDGAYVMDEATHRPCPQVAPLAVAQGVLAARNIVAQLDGRRPASFVPEHHGFVIPVGGQWAISTIGFPSASWLGWLMRKREDWKYFRSILTLSNAWDVFWSGAKVYLRND